MSDDIPPPDDTWLSRDSKPQPALDQWVEVCWALCIRGVVDYQFGRARLVLREGRRETTTTWHSHAGELIFVPTYWRPEGAQKLSSPEPEAA